MDSDDLAHVAVWSNSDFPYMCLRDRRRTEAFRDAIQYAVRPGHVVVEVGAGSGILSLFAAAAGATHVVAVEIDPDLAATMRRTVDANGFSDVIEVVEGNALEVSLPIAANVVIAEMIDTALIDEMQVPVLNHLHSVGVIAPTTAVVPAGYTTRVELVEATFDYYGMTVLATKHLWPFYDADDSWHETSVRSASTAFVASDDDFAAGRVPPVVDEIVTFLNVSTDVANALRLSGTVHFAGVPSLGATNALNGHKVLPIPTRVAPNGSGSVAFRLRWQRGGGLSSLQIEDMTLQGES